MVLKFQVAYICYIQIFFPNPSASNHAIIKQFLQFCYWVYVLSPKWKIHFINSCTLEKKNIFYSRLIDSKIHQIPVFSHKYLYLECKWYGYYITSLLFQQLQFQQWQWEKQITHPASSFPNSALYNPSHPSPQKCKFAIFDPGTHEHMLIMLHLFSKNSFFCKKKNVEQTFLNTFSKLS